MQSLTTLHNLPLTNASMFYKWDKGFALLTSLTHSGICCFAHRDRSVFEPIGEGRGDQIKCYNTTFWRTVNWNRGSHFLPVTLYVAERKVVNISVTPATVITRGQDLASVYFHWLHTDEVTPVRGKRLRMRRRDTEAFITFQNLSRVHHNLFNL